MKRKIIIILTLLLFTFLLNSRETERKMNEIFERNFYKTYDGKAFVQLPELSDNWKITKENKGVFTYINLNYYQNNQHLGAITLTFTPESEDPITSQQIAGFFLQINQKKAPDAKITQAKEIEIARGKAYWYRLGTKYGIVDIVGIADGKYSCAMSVGASTNNINFMWQTAEKVLANIYVGSYLPKLKDRNLSQKIEGVFEGPYEIEWDGSGKQYFMTFDKRGYCHQRKPYTELELDMETRYQWDKSKVHQYNISGSKLIINYANGKKRDYDFKKINDRHFIIGGEKYERVDGMGNNMKLDGHYSSSTTYTNINATDNFMFVSSSDYYFSEDGKFSISSYSSMNSMSNDMLNNIRSYSSGFSETKPTRGLYEIKNNRLYLHFTNGTTTVKTFFPSIYNGKIIKDLVYIDGKNYLKD